MRRISQLLCEWFSFISLDFRAVSGSYTIICCSMQMCLMLHVFHMRISSKQIFTTRNKIQKKSNWEKSVVCIYQKTGWTVLRMDISISLCVYYYYKVKFWKFVPFFICWWFIRSLYLFRKNVIKLNWAQRWSRITKKRAKKFDRLYNNEALHKKCTRVVDTSELCPFELSLYERGKK